jgi:enoyl-CoA hydratase/carnithine racemase
MEISHRSVQTSVRNRIGHITLNRPDELDALSLEMVSLIKQHLVDWEADLNVVAVVLRAAGDNAFCTGGDIRMLSESCVAGEKRHITFLREEYALVEYLHNYCKPTIAIVDGLVLGGGMGLLQAVDLRVITERVRMGMPEAGTGFYPVAGGTFFLSRLHKELGIYLGLTGSLIRASDALYANLADWCISSTQVAELDHCLNRMTWSNSPIEEIMELIATIGVKKIPGSDLKAQLPAIDKHFANFEIAHILNSLRDENRPEYEDWAEETLYIINTRSPAALSVTLELLRGAKELSLSNCFKQEVQLAEKSLTTKTLSREYTH